MIVIPVSLISAIFILFVILNHRQNPGSISPLFYTALLAISFVAIFFCFNSISSPSDKCTFIPTTTFSLSLDFLASFIYILQDTKKEKWLYHPTISILALAPVLKQFILWNVFPGLITPTSLAKDFFLFASNAFHQLKFNMLRFWHLDYQLSHISLFQTVT